MKFVTKKNYTLILLLLLLSSLSVLECKSNGFDTNILNENNIQYTIPRFNEIDRLRIRFRKDDIYSQDESFEYDGDLDDLELPNSVETDGEDQLEYETSQENYSNISGDSIQAEDSQYYYTQKNGAVFIDEDSYSNISELVIDKYMENTYLKSYIIVKMTKSRQGYAIL